MSIHVKEIEIPVPWGHVAGKLWEEELKTKDNFYVLLVHGAHDNAASFDYMIPKLPNTGFSYIAIDLPGHGKSTEMGGGLPLEFLHFVYAMDLVLDYFNIKKVHLIGHSLGAQLCATFAKLYQEKIITLTLLDGLLYKDFSAEESLKQIRKRFDQTKSTINYDNFKKYDELVATFLEKRPTEISKHIAENLLERSIIEKSGKFKIRTDRRMRNSISPIFSQEQLTELLRGIKCPTLFIVSEFLCSFMHLKGLYEKIFNLLPFKKEVVEGDHDVHMIYPERVSTIITSHITTAKSRL